MLFKAVSRMGLLISAAITLLTTFTIRANAGSLILLSTNAGVPGNDLSWKHDAYPVGNGKLAAMVYGGITTEEIQFNEDTIWIGQPHHYENTNMTPQRLAAIRDKVFSGSNIWTDAQPYLMSQPLRQASYQPAGSLILNFPHSGATNYARTLDLDTATVAVRYDHGGVTYTRDVFASAPSNGVLVVRLTASQPGKIAFTCGFSTLQPSNWVYKSGNDLVLRAKVSVKPRPEYFATGLTNAIEYEARVRVIAEGGTVNVGSSSISVTNANAVTLLLAVASNFVRFNDISANPTLLCSNIIAGASGLTYEQLRTAQLADYQALFRRVRLDLGSTWKTNLPTGRRIKRVIEGDDPHVVTLYFQMGRYLMIAGSRPGSQPLNLQGKWNNTTNPSWESKMTLNINQEMNYWGAEVCNLSECHRPLFDMIADLAGTGARVARTSYFSRGWVVHHNTDLWRGAAPINNAGGIWPAGGAWLCQHLWWHYQYTGDTNRLATLAYPLMKSAAEFFVDFLIPHRSNTTWLVTNPSHSPEHDHPTFKVPNVAGPTIDNQLVRDLFNNVIQAGDILGVDAEFRSNLMVIRDRVPPNLIGRLGQLQEWLEDVDSPTDTHRHLSHLVALFPGDEITPFHTSTLAAAARVSVDNRGNAGGSTGWDKAWMMCLRNRLLDGDRSYSLLTYLLTNYTSTNLMFTDVANRQVDGTFGALMGVAEMLLQSHRDELFLLPALPNALSNGSVIGLCARGGFQVDIQWQSNKLMSASILSKLGNRCRVRSKWPIEVKLGTNYLAAPMVLPGLWEFPTLAGQTYTIVPANIAEAENLPASTSTGDTRQTVTNAAFSNLRGVLLNANAVGDHIIFTVSNIVAGRYRVIIGADAGLDHGMFQVACGPSDGTLTNIGPVQDTYCATNVVYYLPIKLTTPTNQYLFWTNMLREFDCGTWRAESNVTYRFKLTVVDKNPISTGYNLALDYIKFTPAPANAPPANSRPTDILLSNSNVPENAPAGTLVGALSTVDPDTGDLFSYALVSGEGDNDNDSFVITNGELQTAATFDYEAKSTYNIRVRSTDQSGLWTEKMFTITIADVNEPPAQPHNVAPPDAATEQPLALTLVASAFTDPDTNAEHAASQWVLRSATDATLVFDSGEDAANKTSIVVPAGRLAHGTTYMWQVRYKDNGGAWSGFSIPTTFTTLAPSMSALVQQGELVLAWPTNAVGFALESTTNLTSHEWTPVSAPLSVVSGSFTVALPMTNQQTFYRLQKP